MGRQPSAFLLLRGEACRRPRGPRSSSPEVCFSHLCAAEPEPSLRVGPVPVHIRRAGRNPRGGAWGAGGLDKARATHFVQTGNRRRRGYAVSSRVIVGVAREAPSSGPARARCALVPPSVSRPSCALGWAPGAPGRGRPNSGSSTRRSCSKLGGNC